MEKKFTPGPWEVDKKASLRVSKNNSTICSCAGGQNGDDNEERQANAKIIAASPDMLEALLSIVEYWNSPQKGSLNDHINHSLELAKRAIKKATE